MSIRDEIDELKDEIKLKEFKQDTKKNGKEWAIPFRSKSVMNKSTKTNNSDKVVVQYLTAKGVEEPLMLLPIYGGNLIIYKDKAHEFDPRALWNVRVGTKLFKKIIIREIDRKPVSNLDWDQVKQRGDSTRNDEVLLKMLRLAMIEKIKKQVGAWIWYLIGGLLIAGIAYYVFFT